METYPSTRAVTTCYDQVGRIKAVSGKATPAATSSTNYTGTGAITYAPHGGMLSMIRGDSLTEAWEYNNRLQPTSISVAKTTINAFGASLFYCPNKTATCTTNNGNLLAQSITIPDVDQNFAYDHLNRISSAAEGAEGANWSRNYGYDAYSNRWVVYPSPGVGIDSFTPIGASNFDTKNRLQIQNSDYDPAGNQTQIGGYAFVSDAESRLVSSTQLNETTAYGYDGQGKRVTKQIGAGSPIKYVYDAMGKLAAEYGGTPMLCVTCYFAVDHLGSTRAVTDGAGGVVERHDYLPFGEEIYAAVGGRTDVSTTMKFLNPNEADTLTQKFTGKERDAKTGLDYFGARYMSSAQGRFTSPDPLIGRPGDPQSWNMYAYGRNNPLLYTDPDGQTYRLCDTNGNCYDSYSDADFDRNLRPNSRNGTIFDGKGNQIGSYEHTSFDDLSPFGNMVFNQMSARRQASNQLIVAVVATSAIVGIGGGALAGAGATLPSQGALGLGGNVGARLLPVGVTLQRFANDIIKWGKDAQGKAASIARIATLNLEELKSAGVTRDIAQSWQQFYTYADKMNPANPNAAGRAQLFQAIVDLLDKGK